MDRAPTMAAGFWTAPMQLVESEKCVQCDGYLSVPPIIINPKNNKYSCGRCAPRGGKVSVRDTMYEKLAAFVRFPCDYSCNGCTFKGMFGEQMRVHEDTCKYGGYQCPALECAEYFLESDDLVVHFQSVHKKLFIPSGKFSVPQNRAVRENRLTSVGDHWCVVEITVSPEEGTCTFALRYLVENSGPSPLGCVMKVHAADSSGDFVPEDLEITNDGLSSESFCFDDLADELDCSNFIFEISEVEE